MEMPKHRAIGRTRATSSRSAAPPPANFRPVDIAEKVPKKTNTVAPEEHEGGWHVSEVQVQ